MTHIHYGDVYSILILTRRTYVMAMYTDTYMTHMHYASRHTCDCNDLSRDMSTWPSALRKCISGSWNKTNCVWWSSCNELTCTSSNVKVFSSVFWKCFLFGFVQKRFEMEHGAFHEMYFMSVTCDEPHLIQMWRDMWHHALHQMYLMSMKYNEPHLIQKFPDFIDLNCIFHFRFMKAGNFSISSLHTIRNASHATSYHRWRRLHFK